MDASVWPRYASGARDWAWGEALDASLQTIIFVTTALFATRAIFAPK